MTVLLVASGQQLLNQVHQNLDGFLQFLNADVLILRMSIENRTRSEEKSAF